MFTIASWNVNSLNVRLQHVLDWLQQNQPDVLAIQETKVQDANFPQDAFHEQGWQVVFSGQKTFNGVAIVSKQPAIVKATEFPNFTDEQRRVLGAEVGNTFVLNVYVPNGQAVDSEKYHYKLAWLKALQQYVEMLLQQYQQVVVLGDFNIAPEDIDVHDPVAWEGHVLVSPAERACFEALLKTGLSDSFRQLHDAQLFSWWDYRQAAFQRNRGLRIDHILASEYLSEVLTACWIDVTPRKLERPSDHTPVVAHFS